MALSILMHVAQQQVAEEVGHLRALVEGKRAGANSKSWDASIAVSKAQLRVYYAFLQRDKAKCRTTIDAARHYYTELLGDVMERRRCVIGVVDQCLDETPLHYMGDKPSENARQLGEALQRKMNHFEFMYANL
jgi:hypothetical protein